MNLSIKIQTLIALSCLLASSHLLAQQVTDPTTNTPIIQSSLPVISVNYPGLQNITGQTKFNYIRTQMPDEPVQAWPSANFRYRQVTDYFDGLGRPLQTVNRKGHSDGYDLVKHHVYDSRGKERYQYLPFAATASVLLTSTIGNIKKDVNDEYRSFYDQAGPDEQPYSRTDDDGSVLGRVVKTLAPGRSWVGAERGIANAYRTNNANDNVRVWTIGFGSNDFPVSDNAYATAELSVVTSTDEDGKKKMVFTDKLGRIILTKRPLITNPGNEHQNYACTYYVYDKMGRLRFVIPPKAVALIDGGWNAGDVPELCFSYIYDDHGRLITKTVPGKGLEEYVYDKRDRLVFSRDANLKIRDKWNFVLYDALDRQIATGISDGGGRSRQQVVDLVLDNLPYSLADLVYYVKTYDLYDTYPPDDLAGCKILTHTFYDNYSHLEGINYDYTQFTNNLPASSQPFLVAPPSEASTMTRGKVTGSKIAILKPGTDDIDQYITTANFYDDNGRLIQTNGNNIRDGREINSNIYYFQGMLWRSIIHHENPEAQSIPGATDAPISTFNIVKTFSRNIALGGGNDQVWKITQKINGGPEYELVTYDYDHLGRNTTKSMNVGVQLNEYNMRGSLRHINAEDRTTYPFKPIFEEKLYYDTGFASKLYNGNIAGIIWNGSDNEKRAYGYSYDQLDRLNHAEFRLNDGSWNHISKDYTASNISYDLNGNLQRMDQRGWDPLYNTVLDIDKLTYSYKENSNELISVEDDGGNSALPDFKNGIKADKEYQYDNNGNMVVDDNKGIGAITYNHLNKPTKINVTGKGKIQYFYDALGTVLRKDISGDSTASYEYYGGFVYKDKILQYIVNEEGRARPIANDTSNYQTRFVYDYFIKDHLGNVRSTVTANPINANYLARHEIATANIEQLVFDNIPSVRDGKPVSTDPEDNMAAHLIAEDPEKRIGTAIMLRVMPGDKFTINAESFYEGTYKEGENIPGDQVVESLMSALMGGSTYAGVPLSELPEHMAVIKQTLENPALASQIEALQIQDASPNAPMAHIKWLFFDDRMQLVPALSGGMQIPEQNTNGGWQVVNPGNICNCTLLGPGTLGTVIVYVDNQSVGKDVWFDNIHIEHYTSKVLSEDHYYPFGLTLQTMNNTTNNTGQPYKFVGKDLEKTYGLEMYDFGARMFDPQLGVWHIPDPMADKSSYESPFVYAGNNPIKNVDIGGKYKMDAKQASENKVLSNYLQNNAQSDILKSSTIMAGFEKYSGGNLTRSEVSKATSWGSGPTIRIVDNPGENSDQWMIKGANGFYDPSTNTIELSTKLADQLKNASPEDIQAALYGVFTTLTHETVHYGDYLDGKRQSSNDKSGFGGEPGTAFMEDVFYTETVNIDGENIKRSNYGFEDHSNIQDAKKMMETNKKEGKSDVIPTVPKK